MSECARCREIIAGDAFGDAEAPLCRACWTATCLAEYADTPAPPMPGPVGEPWPVLQWASAVTLAAG